MEQVKVVSEYIKGKFSHFKQDKNNEKLFHFSENGENKSICIIEEKESELEDRTILFSKNFRLLVSEDELNTKADYFAFCFGELFYYVKREDIENPKLHILRYLGEYEISNEDFCHLGIHSTYSLLDGCQKLESYIEKAKYLNFKNLGICERQTLSSVFKFQKVCEKGNIKPIIGEELKIKKGEEFFWFKFYVKNKNGWKNLINLSNIVNVFGKENEKEYINEEDLFDYLDDLIIVLPNDYPFSTSNIAKYNKYEVYYQIDTVEFLDNNYYYNYLSNIKRYISNGYIKKIPPVLIGDSYYLDEEDKELRKVLHKIGNDSEYRFSTKSQHFKSIEEHIDIFSKFWNNKEDKFDEIMGAAISNTMKIADECNFKIEFEKLHIPTAKIDGVPYKHNLDFFEKLIRDRMDELGFTGIAKYEERVKEEYDVIVGADLENYFLIIWDILHWCKNNNILTGLARGSAAGSFIMFLLDIVKINPFDYDLLFSRFLNAGRVASIYIDFIFDDEELTNKYKHISRLAIPEGGDKIAAKYFEGDELGGGIIKGTNVHYEGHISLPDVDMDISDRERVKQFIINKYGEEQFALLGSYNTFKIKAAVKDLARVIGTNMEYAAINIMSNTIFFKEGVDAYFEEVFKTALNNSMFYSFVQENSKIVNCMYWMLDTPKSSSVHPCGVLSIPAEESIFDDFPLSLQKGEYMCEWTGSELDELGFVKNDLLGLAQLEFFENILKLIKDEKIDIYNLPLDDKKVFEYLGNGWNSEVFQFNSYLLINYCKLLKPTKVEDLSVAVAAVRPGPMNNGLHLKYVKRKNGEEAEEYKFGYEEFTKETFGIILFQEQVIRIASYLGNLTLVEGDGLRKCLTGNNYIWTPDGFKQFKQLYNLKREKKQFNTLSFDLKNINFSNQKVKDLWKQYITKDCLRIWTYGGYIECSKDHKIWTNFGWVEAQNLSKKHYLFKEKINKFGNNYCNEDKLYLIIALITEGYLIKDNCQFTNKNIEELIIFKDKLQKVFPGIEYKEYIDTNGVHQIFCKNLQDLLELDRTLSDEKELPNFIFALNKNLLSKVIGWLFDFDGCVCINNKNNISISYSSKSIKLINQISILLSQFGIECSIVEDLRERCIGNYSLYIKNSKNIHIFYNEFNLYCKKLIIIKDFIKTYNCVDTSIIPFNIWNPIILKLVENSGYSRNELIDSILNNGVAWKSDLEKDTLKKILKLSGRSKELEIYLSDDFYWDKIIKIEEIGSQEVYDFTMSSSTSPQAFINNTLVHNCLGKKKMEEMLKFHDKIKPHALEKGCSEKEFEDIWNEWVEFAKYAFNKSHSVSYALVGYISQWLKVHYPREFWTAAFQKANNSSNREEKFNQYFKELKESNSPIQVVKPEINTATNETTFEGDNIYFPLNNIKYLSNDGVEAILAHKKQYGDYYSFEEFLTRLGKDKLLNKREFENLILSGAFDKIEEIHKPVERKKLIIKLYSYFKKDYVRDFLTEAFQEDELWWELKQLELVGVESINFKNLCGKYFERYRFFDTYSTFEEGQKVNFGGIILDYVERRSKKKGQFFGCITLGCKNIPYDLVMWPDDWEKYKDKVEKYKGQILLFEGEFKKNTMNNQMQLFILPDTTPIFLGSDGTKLEKPKPLTFVKGDFVKIDDNIIGKIVRNASNTQITIELEDGSTKAITKWDIKEVVTGYNDENEN